MLNSCLWISGNRRKLIGKRRRLLWSIGEEEGRDTPICDLEEGEWETHVCFRSKNANLFQSDCDNPWSISGGPRSEFSEIPTASSRDILMLTVEASRLAGGKLREHRQGESHQIWSPEIFSRKIMEADS